MKPAYIASVEVGDKLRTYDTGTFAIRVRSLIRVRPRPHGKHAVSRSRETATTQRVEGSPPERKPRSPFEILAAEEAAITIKNRTTGEPTCLLEDGSSADLPSMRLRFSAHNTKVASAIAQPEQRETRKSMSRRSGQTGNLVKQGCWWRVRFRLDQPGNDTRKQMSVRVAPVSMKLSRPELERRARDIVEKSGANSEERFNQTVLGEVTFREQAKAYLQKAVSRNRKPLRDTVSIEGAMNKWIYPAVGNLPLRLVDNLAVKPLVEKMCASGLKPRTVNKYVEYIKQVVKSLRAPNGEPVHNRTWDAVTMDLPVVEHSEQKRPSLKASAISELIALSTGQEQALYVLLAASGMRISEALALETRHFVNDARTIKVEQQVKKDCPRIVKYLKSSAARREIDLHSDVAEFLQRYTTGKTGLLFHTANGTPHLYNNLEDRWLTPRLVKMGLDEEGMGWHSFKRFRKTWLRGRRCLEDINNFWMAHKPETMSELYSHLHEELDIRLEEVERVGYGFDLPKGVVAPNAPRKSNGKSGNEIQPKLWKRQN
jgi:integrase